MTWNIRLGLQEGLSAVADVLTAEAPDVVALQEVGRRWVMGPGGDSTAWLADRAGFPTGIFVPSLAWFPPAQYGHALLCRHDVESATMHRLPQMVDEERTYLASAITVDGVSFTCVTTHLSHVGDRPSQGDELVTMLEGLNAAGSRFVLMGDLNEEDLGTEWLSRLARIASAAPVPDKTFPADAPAARIDWIWANFGRWSDARVLQTGRASDHLPVVARLDPD